MTTQNAETRVLIAEGDAELRRALFRALLERDTFSDTAADGIQVVECLGTREYSVMLLDLTLPKVDTLQLIRHIGAMPTETRPMIMAMAGREISVQLDVDLVQVILRKPIRPVEVAELVQNCIRVVSERSTSGKRLGRRTGGASTAPDAEPKDDDDHPVV